MPKVGPAWHRKHISRNLVVVNDVVSGATLSGAARRANLSAGRVAAIMESFRKIERRANELGIHGETPDEVVVRYFRLYEARMREMERG